MRIFLTDYIDLTLPLRDPRLLLVHPFSAEGKPDDLSFLRKVLLSYVEAVYVRKTETELLAGWRLVRKLDIVDSDVKEETYDLELSDISTVDFDYDLRTKLGYTLKARLCAIVGVPQSYDRLLGGYKIRMDDVYVGWYVRNDRDLVLIYHYIVERKTVKRKEKKVEKAKLLIYSKP